MSTKQESAFVQEIRDEQFKKLLGGTVAVVIALGVLLVLAYDTSSLIRHAPFALSIIGGSIATSLLSKRGHYRAAAWTYIVTVLAGLSALMIGPPDSALAQVTPFFFPLLIVVTGSLLSPGAVLAVLLASITLTLVVPNLRGTGVPEDFVVPWGAMLVSILAAAVASVTSGQLFTMAEWALQNYRRAHEQTFALRANRLELERSLAAREALNQQLDEARRAAEQAKQRRGQFLADMSHELRTPLNAILGFSEMMLHFAQAYAEPLPPDYHLDLEQIYTSGQQLLAVINDVLDLSKVDAGKLDLFFSDVDIRATLEDCMVTAAGLVKDKPIALRFEVPSGLPRVYADPGRVRQVALNLIGNAVKFTDSGHITVSASANGECVTVRVIDTGIGIAPDYHEAIFQEFVQVNAPGRGYNPGAGLGLPISKRLVEMHGGRIWVESAPNEGSTFAFTLPCVTAAVPQPT